jgi:hypothetical protein
MITVKLVAQPAGDVAQAKMVGFLGRRAGSKAYEGFAF